MELPAEAALVVGELHHGHRRVLAAEPGPVSEVHVDSRAGLGVGPCRPSTVFEQLADLPQFVQNLVGLLARDSGLVLLLVRGDGRERQTERQGDDCQVLIHSWKPQI